MIGSIDLNHIRHTLGISLSKAIPSSARSRLTFWHTFYYAKLAGLLGYDHGGRPIEYEYVLNNLRGVERGRVLEVGCTGSYVHAELIARGFRVYGIDVNDFPRKHPKLIFIKQDICESSLPGKFFDAVIAVSTIEHIGLGAYGDPVYREGDRTAVKEITRVLADDGIAIFTLPYSKKAFVDWQRHYDEDQLRLLLNGLTVLDKKYYTRLGNRWVMTTTPSNVREALVCLKITRSRPLWSHRR